MSSKIIANTGIEICVVVVVVVATAIVAVVLVFVLLSFYEGDVCLLGIVFL